MKSIRRRHVLAAIAATFASPLLRAQAAAKPDVNITIKPTDALLAIDM